MEEVITDHPRNQQNIIKDLVTKMALQAGLGDDYTVELLTQQIRRAARSQKIQETRENSGKVVHLRFS